MAVYEETKRSLQSATDAHGRRLAITELPGPDRREIRGRGEEFLSSYTNYYTANGAVIAPQFGDGPADGVARAILQAAYPGHRSSSSPSTASPPAAAESTAPPSRTRPCRRPSDGRAAPAGADGPARRGGPRTVRHSW